MFCLGDILSFKWVLQRNKVCFRVWVLLEQTKIEKAQILMGKVQFCGFPTFSKRKNDLSRFLCFSDFIQFDFMFQPYLFCHVLCRETVIPDFEVKRKRLAWKQDETNCVIDN